jgi:ribosomal protein S18 acetylase RimI-like enzyme
MSEAIIIRPATLDDVPGIARVHVDSWRTTYAGIVPEEYLATLSYEDAEARWQRWLSDTERRMIVLAAVKGDRVIGFASGGNERDGRIEFTGELYAIYLFREAQGRGTGKRLFDAMASALHNQGHDSLLIWVLAQNRSREFYRRIGGELVATKVITIGGVELEEEGYGWRGIEG